MIYKSLNTRQTGGFLEDWESRAAAARSYLHLRPHTRYRRFFESIVAASDRMVVILESESVEGRVKQAVSTLRLTPESQKALEKRLLKMPNAVVERFVKARSKKKETKLEDLQLSPEFKRALEKRLGLDDPDDPGAA